MPSDLAGAALQLIAVLRRYFRPSGSPPEMPKWMFSVDVERKIDRGIRGESALFSALVSQPSEPQLREAIEKIPQLREIATAIRCVEALTRKEPPQSRFGFLFKSLLAAKWIGFSCSSTIHDSPDIRPEGGEDQDNYFGYSFRPIDEGFFDQLREACEEIAIGDHASDANIQKLFPNGVPGDPDIRDLAVRLNAAKGTGKHQAEIAREVTKETVGDDPKAKALLARIRMFKNRGKLNL